MLRKMIITGLVWSLTLTAGAIAASAQSIAPARDYEDYDLAMEGRWRLAGGSILLSHQQRTYECRVTWMDDNSLTIESDAAQVRATYERKEAGEQ